MMHVATKQLSFNKLSYIKLIWLRLFVTSFWDVIMIEIGRGKIECSFYRHVLVVDNTFNGLNSIVNYV